MSFTAIITIAITCIIPSYAAGQDLFSFVKGADIEAVKFAQSEKLQTYMSDPTTKEIQIMSLQMDLLKSADKVNINLLPDLNFPVDSVRLDERSPQDYTWFGSSSETEGDAILVVQDNSVVGTIRSGNKMFRVRPLDEGLHALILVDESKFPPDHHPEFEKIEQDPQSMFDPEAEDTGTEDVCTEYTAIIAYTAAAKSQAGNIDGLIQLAIDETNQSYANSKINTKIKLAHKYQTSYNESGNMAQDRDRFRIKSDNFMDEVHNLRDNHAADVAILITKNGGYCGIASAIMANVDTAFAVVGQNCATGYYSFAHEIGHLQGARHNPEADPTNTPFPYGHGFYHQPGKWRTIMSYNCPGGCTRLKYWSNPNVKYGGVDMGTANHNNARVLNETACKVANFKTTAAPSAGPLAFGVVLSNGKKYSGTSNWTSTFNPTYKRYEIKITGESYYYLRYTTNVTPAGDIGYCRSSSVGGKLLVYCYDKNGVSDTARFAFVTFKE
jgi:hypothetical protein